eukprot:tig00020629_g12475.t1
MSAFDKIRQGYNYAQKGYNVGQKGELVNDGLSAGTDSSNLLNQFSTGLVGTVAPNKYVSPETQQKIANTIAFGMGATPFINTAMTGLDMGKDMINSEFMRKQVAPTYIKNQKYFKPVAGVMAPKLLSMVPGGSRYGKMFKTGAMLATTLYGHKNTVKSLWKGEAPVQKPVQTFNKMFNFGGSGGGDQELDDEAPSAAETDEVDQAALRDGRRADLDGYAGAEADGAVPYAAGEAELLEGGYGFDEGPEGAPGALAQGGEEAPAAEDGAAALFAYPAEAHGQLL